ncbi:MAG: 30S ribosomal protein S5 [Lentisphaerae bacterium]|nr:30S ribosomal protein S5 [Lentisphaerota bacterium]MBT4819157.1 30S ribosomal protein S5 [Lentisphaerota bacterium]MBT5607348.1 30S ribosomal protein S5 [Lentisphaerota bacterium]MBT7058358.1 30S ribosomal protein S5 [Lentisphaerota bacterium]MBT7841675.1 30S ribosomal protein S5 [Lentisphaerota bacterium]
MAQQRPGRQQDGQQDGEFEERVVAINRSSKVVKGGRNFHFSALIVVGDRNGRVGVGFGKANEVADAIRKGGELARRAVITIPLKGQTLPHAVRAGYRGGEVIMRPASEGTGIIAGGGMRAVLELGGVRDVLAKSLGSKNPINVVKATMAGIAKLRTKDQVLQKRDISSFQSFTTLS